MTLCLRGDKDDDNDHDDEEGDGDCQGLCYQQQEGVGYTAVHCEGLMKNDEKLALSSILFHGIHVS